MKKKNDGLHMPYYKYYQIYVSNRLCDTNPDRGIRLHGNRANIRTRSAPYHQANLYTSTARNNCERILRIRPPLYVESNEVIGINRIMRSSL